MSTHDLPPPTARSRAGRRPESYTWPLLAMLAVILLQVSIPARDRIGPPAAVPTIEAAAFLVLLIIAAKPGPVPKRARPTVLVLFTVLILSNALGTARLVLLVLDGHPVDGVALSANRLLVAGSIALTTNVITFALMYWQLDGGGPDGRIRQPPPYPEFQFPQSTQAGLAAPEWTPRFYDYLYVAFTNLVAFSPTDTMPLTARAKGLMAAQSIIALGVLVVVISRVINILPTP